MSQLPTVVKVDVLGKIREYPQMIAELGEHLASGGTVGALHGFLNSCAETLKSDWVRSIDGWVEIDDSGLAYSINVTGRRHYTIQGAAPWSLEARSGDLTRVYTA